MKDMYLLLNIEKNCWRKKVLCCKRRRNKTTKILFNDKDTRKNKETKIIAIEEKIYKLLKKIGKASDSD